MAFGLKLGVNCFLFYVSLLLLFLLLFSVLSVEIWAMIIVFVGVL
jgi:hypothetical protein